MKFWNLYFAVGVSGFVVSSNLPKHLNFIASKVKGMISQFEIAMCQCSYKNEEIPIM